MNSYTDSGRTRLIHAVVAKGYSFRKATELVNAVFETMTRALNRGEQVEIPGGRIQVKQQNGKPRRELHKFQDPGSERVVVRSVKYSGARKIVKFIADEDLDLSPLPDAPPPAHRETQEMAACRKLAAELVGEPIDDACLQFLLRISYSPARSPISLLRTLRQCRV